MSFERAIVTGAAGFIGQHLVRFLEDEGIGTVGLDRALPSKNGRPVDAVVDLAIEGALMPYLDTRTAIFHLAGSADVRASVERPVPDFRENVVSTLHVLESARKTGCRVLFPSSGSVYDPKGPLPFHETSPIGPSSPYAAAKAAGEAYCFAYRRSYGVDARVVRMFSVFGPGMGRFAIRDFFTRLREHPEALVVRGDGGQTRDYLYVADAARALYRVLRKGEPGGVYNVAAGHPRGILSVARAVAAAMGLPKSDVRADGTPFDAELYRMEANVDRLIGLGFRPSVSFEEGISMTVAWLRDHSAAEYAPNG